jgi:fructose-specific phosphotransferase system IIC component
VPVAGHLKGGIHHLCGDHDGGNRALESSSRTTGVIVGGVGGFAVGGPVGAFAGGIGGGLVVDGVTTGIESSVKGKYVPSGHIAGVTNIVRKTQNGENVSVELFDTVVGVTFDGLLGKTAL